MNIEIRHLFTPEEAYRAVALERAIWGGDETPGHVMLTAGHNGGLLAGAFVDGALAGFVWGFLGFDERTQPPRLKHCSHQLGVHPAYRNLGLGFLLKRFQWAFVRSQGIELITWTYDPLLAANAHLNIARLSAVCNTYRRDEYGNLNDDLNAGLPTDRFQVDLWVNSERAAVAMSGGPRSTFTEETCWLNQPDPDGKLLPPAASDLAALPQRVALAIPLDFQAVRSARPEASATWRYATRDVFEALFRGGYTVVDFLRRPACGVYMLQRDLPLTVK